MQKIFSSVFQRRAGTIGLGRVRREAEDDPLARLSPEERTDLPPYHPEASPPEKPQFARA